MPDQDTIHQFADAMEIIGISKGEPIGNDQGLRHAARQLRLLTVGMTDHMDPYYRVAMLERPRRNKEAAAHD